MANFVQLYKSTDLNAPVLTGQVGSLITLLNKCLVDGYTTASVTSITRGGPGNLTALAKMGAANTTLVNGNVLVVTGATGTGNAQYNITSAVKVPIAWAAAFTYPQGSLVINDSGKTYVCRTAGISAGSGGPTGTGTAIADNTATWDYVDAVGNSTLYFSYPVASDPGANASGTLLYAKAPLAWTRAFAAGTNAQTYRSADNSSNQFYLQVIDNGATAGGAREAQIYGGEIMTADQVVNNGGGAGSGQFPTTGQLANGLCARKSNTADATARAWTLWGDDRTFMMVANGGGIAQDILPWGFGHFFSHKVGDVYNTFVAGATTFNTSAPGTVGLAVVGPLGVSPAGGGIYIARSYSQTGGAVPAILVGYSNSASGGTIGSNASAGALLTYPNPADSGLYVEQLLIGDAASNIRGRMPGYFAPLHFVPFTQYDLSTGVTGLPGITLTAVNVSANAQSGQALIDTFGPWT